MSRQHNELYPKSATTIRLEDEIEALKADITNYRALLTWVGEHIHVRNANGQHTTAKCALCPFTYKRDNRGRTVKEACRHGEIWQAGM